MTVNSTTNPAPDLLTTVIDTIVPADDYPSASAAGGLEFLHRIRENERPEWSRRISAVVAKIDAAAWQVGGNGFIGLDVAGREAALASVGDDPEFGWFARLVNYGYYGDGPRPAAWQMIDWQPEPEGGWPAELPRLPFDRAGLITPDELEARYDAIVVGSGAGGGAVAQVLAESGRRVLIIESGTGPVASALDHDHLHNPRLDTGLGTLTGPTADNANTIGGGTRVYGAQAWRLTPQDMRMASEYGVPDGSSLADWPISYDDLEPYYTEAEWRFGVSGSATGDPWAGARSRDYPMPAVISGSGRRQRLAGGADRLGWGTMPAPLLINSTAYAGRAGCAHCAMCVGFACPIEAKSGSHNTSIPAALATGNGFLIASTTVEKLITDVTGRVTGVAVVGDQDGRLWRRQVAAAEVIVSAGAIATAQLLLASSSDREPNGIGNNADQVGRHLQGHLYAGALGLFEGETFGLDGPGASIATCDFRHGNDGLIGGGMLANEFVPIPASTFDYLAGAGVFPPYGAAAKNGMRLWTRRMERVVGPIQELSTDDARVRLDPSVRDRFGRPVAVLSGAVHPEDRRARDFMTAKAREWLEASGATAVFSALPGGAGPSGPSAGQHQAGTCRMGTDPQNSVTDPLGKVWGHDNLWVADGSLHVTNGGVNPVLTILANSLRVADRLVDSAG